MALQDELPFVIDVARGAGRIVRERYGKVERLTKTHAAASQEAVTDADRASQRYIVQRLRERFPDDGIVGEENDLGTDITFDCPDPKGRVWVIDPVDGTNNFVAGMDYFAVCIGLLVEGEPVLGVVYDVCRDRVYSAARGAGAFLDDAAITAPTTPMNSSSLLVVTANLLDKQGRLPAYAVRWFSQTEWKMRCLGSAALDMMLVASGAAHGAITLNGKIWDVAAPAAVALEAGAKVTAPDGTPIFPFDLRNYCGAKVPFLAAGPAAHGTLLAEIAGK
jgi:myo-inositol-1(or 4)-monophosphatase